MNKGTYTNHSEVLVPLDPVEAHRLFMKHTFWGGGSLPAIPYLTATTETIPPQDESGKGGERQVPLFIREKIENAELGKFIEYTLSRKVWFPASHHRGRVNFHQAGPGYTRVTWDINITPKAHAPLMLWFLWLMIDFFMWDYKRVASKGKKGNGSWLGFIGKALLFLYLGFVISRAMRLPSKPSHPGTEYLNALAKIREDSPEVSQFVAKSSFLVIGGTGFTGSGIVQDLKKRGAKKIKILGRSFPPVIEFPYGPSKEDRYPIPGVEYVRGDVTNDAALKEAMKDVDVVFHTAVAYGTPSFTMLRDYEGVRKINVEGMKNIVKAAKEAKSVKQIIYTSSVDTVFTHKALHHVNETHPYAAHGDMTSQYATDKWEIGDFYAKTKIEAEKFLLSQDNKDGIRTVALRPNGIFGPGESIMVKRSMDTAFLLGAIPFYFDDTIKNDFTCLGNLVYAHMLATYKLASDPSAVGGKAYHITDDEVSSIANFDIVKPIIENVAGPVRKWLWIPGSILPPSGVLQEYLNKFFHDTLGMHMPIFLGYKESLKLLVTHYFDNSRAKKDLGYKPKITTGQCQMYVTEEVKRRYGVA